MDKNRRKLAGVLTGFALVTIVSINYYSNHVIDMAKSVAEKDKIAVNETINSIDVNSVTSSRNMVEYKEKGNYSMLSFDDVGSFLNSLQSIVRVENADTLYRQVLYDSDEGILVDIYENGVGSVSVAVSPENDIAYCKFQGVSKDEEAKIKDLMESKNNKTEYRYKVINNGFILEPETSV